MAKDEDRAREATELAQWCTGVTNYLRRLGSDPILDEMDGAIARALKAQSVGQLKAMRRELAEWARTLTPAQQKEMDESIRARVGGEPSGKPEPLDAAVGKILKRGSIRTESEYRLLGEWMDRMSDDDSRRAEIEQIDVLLTQFGTRLK